MISIRVSYDGLAMPACMDKMDKTKLTIMLSKIDYYM